MKFHAKQIQAIRWPEARRHECHVWEAVVVTKALVTLLMPMPQVFRKAEGGRRKQRRIRRLIGGGDAVWFGCLCNENSATSGVWCTYDRAHHASWCRTSSGARPSIFAALVLAGTA